MAVDILIPQKKQDSSIGRRLFSMAAPIVGGIAGGPWGAAAGGLIGAKLGGASTTDALASGAQAGVGDSGSQKAGVDNRISTQFANESAFSRRLAAKTQDPNLAINEGLQTLSALPADHPLRQELAPGLVKAQMMAERQRGIV